MTLDVLVLIYAETSVKLKLAFVFPEFQEHRAQPNSLAAIRHLASPCPDFFLKKAKKPKELTVVTPQEMCAYFIHYDLYVLLPPDLYGI